MRSDSSFEIISNHVLNLFIHFSVILSSDSACVFFLHRHTATIWDGLLFAQLVEALR